MAKKSGVKKVVDSVGDAVVNVLMGGIFPKLKEGAFDVIDSVGKQAVALQERIIRRVTISVVNGLAILFFLFSLFYYLIDYQGLSRTSVFLYLGIGLLVVAFLLKYQMMKEELR